MRHSVGFDGERTVIVDKRVALRVLAALRAVPAVPMSRRESYRRGYASGYEAGRAKTKHDDEISGVFTVKTLPESIKYDAFAPTAKGLTK